MLCAPLIFGSLGFVALAVIGVSQLPAAEQATLLGDYAAAAVASVICLILAVPAASLRPSLLWLVPLVANWASGVAGWSLLPLPLAADVWMRSFGAAVLLLPVMVLVLGAWWRLIPSGLGETAATCGAPPSRAFFHSVLVPALPGAARGLALVFVLALGVMPLLAAASGRP